jgi:hypothetical protein
VAILRGRSVDIGATALIFVLIVLSIVIIVMILVVPLIWHVGLLLAIFKTFAPLLIIWLLTTVVLLTTVGTLITFSMAIATSATSQRRIFVVSIAVGACYGAIRISTTLVIAIATRAAISLLIAHVVALPLLVIIPHAVIHAASVATVACSATIRLHRLFITLVITSPLHVVIIVVVVGASFSTLIIRIGVISLITSVATADTIV